MKIEMKFYKSRWSNENYFKKKPITNSSSKPSFYQTPLSFQPLTKLPSFRRGGKTIWKKTPFSNRMDDSRIN